MSQKDLIKEKIRQRYKGISTDEIEVIPAIPEINYFDDNHERRVGVYVRVSTDDPRQTSSYELQKNHYMDVINRHPGWKLVDIYADEGISGTSVKHREAFARMINDCYAGKIDFIVTKSVSRFARNILDCVGYARELSNREPRIGILFEAENICTLDKNSDMALSIIAALAQQESFNKSEIMNASIEMRFRRGIFLTPPSLGYDKDEDGNLIINEKEASIVRLIFFMYLYGYTCRQIADTLTKLNCVTKKDNTHWAPGSVLNILQNERYYGAVLARKTWTPNYLDHKSKKNKQNRNQYRHYNNHEAIISRDDFIAVQHFINNVKYGNKRILPELKVIHSGVLTGFVTIHPHWAGFKADDYLSASHSAGDNQLETDEKSKIILSDGAFDFSGYEIARPQFFNTSGKIFMSISDKKISFSSECINKLNCQYVEMLICPDKKYFAVRIADSKNNLSVKWARNLNGHMVPKNISGLAYLGTIYKLLGWKQDFRYRIQGTYYSRDNSPVIMFDMNDTEVFVRSGNSNTSDNSKPLSASGNHVVAYPADWANGFGRSFYTHAQKLELENYINTGIWNVDCEGKVFDNKNMPHIPTQDEISKRIKDNINNIKRDNKDG